MSSDSDNESGSGGYRNESGDYENESFSIGCENESDSKCYKNELDSEGYKNESYSEGHKKKSDSKGYENESDSEGYENESDSKGYENESYSEGYENESYSERRKKKSDSKSYENESDSEGYENESDSKDYENESYSESYENESYSGHKKKSKSKGSKAKADERLTTKIFTTLEQMKTPCTFAYGASDLSLPNPGLDVPPHGILGLPLWPDHAQKIISQARQSPFGKGEETVVDTAVRKSWELNPNEFSLKNPEWNKAMKTILDTVTAELGVTNGTGNVSAQIHKLLLYESGAFFKPHRDSEKAPGMFATLVVCLPSPHEGGKLVMTHDNEKYEFETASSSSFGSSYAAWYADITHEVLPVTSGYRLMLVYNLIRQADVEILSYSLILGRVQQLSALLQEYNSQLEAGDKKLPPILVHKLDHKYTKASLKLNMLKPPDVAQVQTLRQLATELGFDIYLATLELVVRTDDEYDGSDIDEKTQELKNVVELNGKLVVESVDYPDGALIDPKGQGKKRKADKEDHAGPTGNEGAPAIYWYRDTVVALLPPSKKLDFVCKFGSGSVIEPLFCKFMKEFSADPAQKPKLEQLCELALKQKRRDESSRIVGPYSYYRHPYSSAGPGPRKDTAPYFKQAVATALDLGRLDLFDKACETTKNKIVLDYAGALGRWAAKNGVAKITDRLMKGVRVASPVAEKIKFLKAVAEGFETVVPKPSSAERASFKQWSDEAILTAMAELERLTEDDVKSLAQLCKTTDWSLFEAKTKLIISKAVAKTKIMFIDEFTSALQGKLDENHRSFVETIIRSIWKKFAFEANCCKAVSQTSSHSWYDSRSDSVNKTAIMNDILHIIENTIKILSSKSVEKIIIPAMLTAIPGASKERTKDLFILLVQRILKNKLAGFELPTKTVPPLSHKRLVQALLTKSLLDNVDPEPQAKDWSLPAGSCDCDDCSLVNKFLRDPAQETFDFPCAEQRRRHLIQTFTDSKRLNITEHSGPTYDIAIIRGKTPFIWRITKHRRSYEAAQSKWMESTKSAAETLAKLKNDKAAGRRLEAYLEPYYSVIMSASVKELPDLKSLVTMPHLPENNENAASALNQSTKSTGLKRGASNNDLREDELTKRPRP